jgi:hypothetical protein
MGVMTGLAFRPVRVRAGEPSLTAGTAQSLLADIGFLLVPGLLDHGSSYLLVALRPRPTRRHFDPERIGYWALDDKWAARHELEWPMAALQGDYEWGPITIVDRLGATNSFVSFGGRLTTSRDGDVHAALFHSEAPILAAGGHSGRADAVAASVSAFFAALRAASGNDTRIATLAATLDPLALYAAFLTRTLRTYRTGPAADVASPRRISLLRAERQRIAVASPVTFDAGEALGLRV